MCLSVQTTQALHSVYGSLSLFLAATADQHLIATPVVIVKNYLVLMTLRPVGPLFDLDAGEDGKGDCVSFESFHLHLLAARNRLATL